MTRAAALAHRLTVSPFAAVEASVEVLSTGFRPDRRVDRGEELPKRSTRVHLPLSFLTMLRRDE